jgi:hypothetical protein
MTMDMEDPDLSLDETVLLPRGCLAARKQLSLRLASLLKVIDSLAHWSRGFGLWDASLERT